MYEPFPAGYIQLPFFPFRFGQRHRPQGFWNLPFYDPLDNKREVVWRLSYFKPYYLPLAFEEEGYGIWRPFLRPALWQACLEAYLLHSLTPVGVPKPFTRVRFDQSSRRTQLLSVEHVQNFSPQAGILGQYQRRTRTGEYLGQTTDHYGVGALLYGQAEWLYGSIQAVWNQLADEINGGSLYDSVQGSGAAFQKERQPVRFVNGRWRLWHRLVRAEGGLLFRKSSIALGVEGQVRQTYGGWQSGPARVPASPFGVDTGAVSTFAFGEEQVAGLRFSFRPLELRANLLRWWGRGEGWQPFYQRAAELYLEYLPLSSPDSAGYSYTTRLNVFYRRWLSLEGPSPEVFVHFYASRPRVRTRIEHAMSLQYSQRALPWFFYQAYPGSRLRNPETLSLTLRLSYLPHQSGMSGISGEVWLLGQRWPLLFRQSQAYQPEGPLWWYGIRLKGEWEVLRLGLHPVLLLQRPVVSDTLRWWTRQVPLLTGWVQVHYRWQIPPFRPVYRLGFRVRGSSLHQPPQYEPAYGLFFASERTPPQPAWAAVDVFLVVSLRQVSVYLRIDHAAEGLFSPGSFWAHPYPVPGRAFSFGFMWELWN